MGQINLLRPLRKNEKFVRIHGLILKIIKDLNGGGMADIVLCEEVTSKGRFVLKSQKIRSGVSVPTKNISRSTFNNTKKYRHFREEVIAYVKLMHPNIVDFYGFEIVGGLPRILLSFVEGGTLLDWVSENKCNDLKTALKILIQIANGMKVAHENGLIHRDLKPSNILMKENRSNNSFICKISDFGIVKISNTKRGKTSRSNDNSNNSDATKFEEATLNRKSENKGISFISEAIGTPGYGAPEQFGLVPGKIHKDADLFSFGVIACEILTRGHRPRFYNWYQSNKGIVFDPASLVKDSRNTIKNHFSEYAQNCPPPLIELISNCVAVNPSNRWKDEKVTGTFTYFGTILKELAKIYKALFGEAYRFSDVDSALNEDIRYSIRAKTLKNLGESESEIETYFIHLDKMTPRNFLEWSNKSKYLLDRGRVNEALKAAEKSISLNPEFVLSWYNKGNALDEKGKKQEAIEAYEKAIEIDPSYSLSYYYKAKTCSKLGRYYEGLDAFCKAIEFDEFDISSWYDKEKLLFDLQLYDEALICLEKITELDPYHSNAWFRMGEVLSALNRIDDALKCYDKVIVLEKDSSDAWENKGTLLRIKIQQILTKVGIILLPATRNKVIKLFYDAEIAYNKAIEIDPGDGVSHFKRAALLIERSRIDNQNKEFLINRGLVDLKRAVAISSDYKKKAMSDSSFESIFGNQKFRNIVA